MWLTLLGCFDLGSVDKGPSLRTDFGVDVAARRIRIGTLNDESGPAKSIGHPFAIGKRVLAARVNEGGTGLLPDGWTIELVERDHEYVPAKAAAALQELRDQVLFVGTSFGTEQTLVLQDRLVPSDLVAFPASLSTALIDHPLTPPLGASYEAEARRAIDHVIVQADGQPVRIAVVHQDDTYGRDVAEGARLGAEAYGLSLALDLSVTDDPSVAAANLGGQLAAAQITHVVLGTLPPHTAALLEDARVRASTITWVGATPAWSDRFVVAPDAEARLARYYQASSLPFWGEDVPGMSEFEAGFRAYGGGETADGYVLTSYVQGMVQLEAAREAIEAGDITRAGYRRALASLRSVDAGGMLDPLDLSRLPGAVTERVRVLEPRVAAAGPRFEEVMPAARPGPRRERPGQAAMEDDANSGSNPGEVSGEEGEDMR